MEGRGDVLMIKKIKEWFLEWLFDVPYDKEKLPWVFKDQAD